MSVPAFDEGTRSPLRVCGGSAARFVVVVAIGLFSRDSAPERLSAIDAPSYSFQMARTGDVIFRRGRSLRSRAVLLADQVSPYSHVGVVLRSATGVWVIAAEPPTAERSGGVELESMRDFLNAEQAAGGGLYRSRHLSGAQQVKLTATLMREVSARIPFDDDFSLTTTDRLYCTEMVWQAYASVGIRLLDALPPARLTPLGRRVFIYPSDLLQSHELEEVPNFAQLPGRNAALE